VRTLLTCSTGRTKLTVTDFASFCGLLDCLYYLGNDIGLDNQLDFYLGDQINHVFGSAVDFLVPLLATVAFDIGDGHPLNAKFGEGILDFIQPEGLDDCFDFFSSLSLFLHTQLQWLPLRASTEAGRRFHPAV